MIEHISFPPVKYIGGKQMFLNSVGTFRLCAAFVDLILRMGSL